MNVLNPAIHPDNFQIEGAPAEWGAPVATMMADIVRGFEAVAKARDDIMADVTMTEAARMLALDTLFEKHVGSKVEAASSVAFAVRGAAIQANTARDAIFAPASNPAAVIVASEVRQALARLPLEERMEAVQAAVASGDRTIVSAVVSAPAFLSGLSGDIQQAYRDQFIAQHFPQIDREVEAAQLLMKRGELARSALANVRRNMFSPADERLIGQARQSSSRAKRHLN